ncbi:three-helix bundle dimerization domain-containing protein [Mycobacterium sp. ML4]
MIKHGRSEQTLIADIEYRLTKQFPHVQPEILEAVVREEHSRFRGSRIRDFVPLLVEKHVRRLLSAAAVSER